MSDYKQLEGLWETFLASAPDKPSDRQARFMHQVFWQGMTGVVILLNELTELPTKEAAERIEDMRAECCAYITSTLAVMRAKE